MDRRIVAVVLLLISIPVQSSNTHQLKIADFGKSVVLPYHWYNYCTNEMEGSNVELIKWIFKRLNTSVHLSTELSNDDTSIQDRYKELRNGSIDAIFAVDETPVSGIIKIKTPVIETGLSIFYPAHLGQISNTAPLRHIPGVLFQKNKRRGTAKIVKQWAENNQLNISLVDNEKAFKQFTQSSKDHFVLIYKFTEELDRSRYKILENQLSVKSYYFALADRSPWKQMLPQIEQRFEFAKTSGLVTLLKETSFKLWLKEKDTILACKQALEAG